MFVNGAQVSVPIMIKHDGNDVVRNSYFPIYFAIPTTITGSVDNLN